MALTRITVPDTVLQVKTAVDTALRTTTSSTFVVADNTAQVSITPLAATSKFLITCCGTFSSVDGDDAWFASIFRDSTNLGHATRGLAHGNSVPAVSINFMPCSMTILDSPSTASAITYGLRFRSYNADSDGYNTARLGQTLAGTSTIIPTHIVVTEIAG